VPDSSTLADLAAGDPVLARLVRDHGPAPTRRPVPVALRFSSLVRSIVSQQLAGKAADAIHGRFVLSLGGAVTPEAVLAAGPETLTGAGLSRAKAASIRDLAERVSRREITLDRVGRWPDEAVVAHLVQVRGIGRWTAHMFLLGTLARPDIWPTGDLGVRMGFARAWGLVTPPRPDELEVLGEPFRPHRSALAWYCWRAVDDRTAVQAPVSS
jgi:DNA-3-methyladenine glycosylase II